MRQAGDLPPSHSHRHALLGLPLAAQALGPGSGAATEEAPVERAPPRAWDAAFGLVVTHGPRTPGFGPPRHQPRLGWRLRSVNTTGAPGHGGGTLGELQRSRDIVLGPKLGVQGTFSLGWADRRHLQTHFGINPEQAARSGCPVAPMSAGLRGVSLSAGWRRSAGPGWAVFGSAAVTRLSDETAASALVRECQRRRFSAGFV